MRLIAAPDTEPPNTAIRRHPPKRTTKRTAKFTFVASEHGHTFECSLDRAPFKACRSPQRVRVGPGKHRFAVRAIDAAGNVDPRPDEFAWRVTRP